jgi:hypothetical protein
MRILGLQQATVLDNGDLRQDQAISMGDALVPENYGENTQIHGFLGFLIPTHGHTLGPWVIHLACLHAENGC